MSPHRRTIVEFVTSRVGNFCYFQSWKLLLLPELETFVTSRVGNFCVQYSLSEMEFKEFEPRFKSAKTRFKLSAGLNLETFDTILSGTNHI